MENRKEDVEDLIIQGLGHKERRNILKNISLSPRGASYSDILGELGLYPLASISLETAFVPMSQ